MSCQTSIRYPGLSKLISLHSIRGHRQQTTILRAGKQAERLCEIDEQHATALEGMYISLICPLKLV